MLTPNDIINASRDSRDTFVVLDLKDVYQRLLRNNQGLFTQDQLYEIIRQIFQRLRPEMALFTQGIMNLPNFTLLPEVNRSFSPDELDRIKTMVFETGFDIYMSARLEGMFLGAEGENSFPFYLEHLTPSAAYFLLDKIAVNRQSQLESDQSWISQSATTTHSAL